MTHSGSAKTWLIRYALPVLLAEATAASRSTSDDGPIYFAVVTYADTTSDMLVLYAVTSSSCTSLGTS